MKKKTETILLVIVFFVGVLIVSYPYLSNLYNTSVGSYVISEYDNVVGNKNEQDFDDLFQEAREFNKTVSGQPEDFVKGSIKGVKYKNTLDVLNGMMGYLEIDDLDIRLPIYHGTLDDVLQKAIGHLEGSHLPTGDIGNSTVITGHTGLPSANLLTGIDKMEIGDTFEVNVLNHVFTYEVFSTEVVEPHEVEGLAPVKGIDMVTLITCTPYGVNSHRLFVHGKQIDSKIVKYEGGSQSEQNRKEIDYRLVLGGISLLVGLVTIGIIYKKNGNKKGEHE